MVGFRDIFSARKYNILNLSNRITLSKIDIDNRKAVEINVDEKHLFPRPFKFIVYCDIYFPESTSLENHAN